MQAQATPAATNPPILITGGTGTLGRLVVARLRETGHEVRVLSRRSPRDPQHPTPAGKGVELVIGDLATGDGIDAAVEGADVVLHLAGSPKGDEVKARHLVSAASRAGTRHIVFISVVGADRIPIASGIDRAMFGYFGSKLAAERLIADSGRPWSTLRATQFHDLALKTVQGMARLPVVPVPSGWRFQPVDAVEVAERLVELAFGEPAGLVPAIGGPKVYDMADLVRSYLRAVGRRRTIVRMRLPGQAARAFREGANLSLDRTVGRRTWEDFLAARVSSRSGGRLVDVTDG